MHKCYHRVVIVVDNVHSAGNYLLWVAHSNPLIQGPRINQLANLILNYNFTRSLLGKCCPI